MIGTSTRDHDIRIGVGDTWAVQKTVKKFEVFTLDIIYSPPQARVFWNGEDLGQIVIKSEEAQVIHGIVLGNSSSRNGKNSAVVIDKVSFGIF